MPKLRKWMIVLLLPLSLAACSLPMSPTPGNLPTTTPILPILPTDVSPTATLIAIPTEPPTEISPTLAPTQEPSPTQPTSTDTPVPVILPDKTIYAAFLINSKDQLSLRSEAGSGKPVIEQLAADTTGLEASGNQTEADGISWVEVKTPTGKTGWVDKSQVTEVIPAAVFCQDTRIDPLISKLKQVLDAKDGTGLASVISPTHGLYLQYIRGGTLVNYDATKAKWLFESTYQVNWGLHPGSGLPVKGSFSSEPYPALLDVFDSPNTEKHCEDIAAGGTTYTAAWPKELAAINFISYYRPGPAGQELNWRTWLTGIEYVDGFPYILALYQLTWEP